MSLAQLWTLIDDWPPPRAPRQVALRNWPFMRMSVQRSR